VILSFLNKYREGGILLLRAGVGLMLVCSGFPIVAGGSGHWRAAAPVVTQFFHITSHLAFWGGLVAFSELIGGGLLILGLMSRVVCLILAIAILCAGIAHIRHHPSLNVITLVLTQVFIAFALLLIGPGKYSFDKD